jgi:hypothetical protein
MNQPPRKLRDYLYIDITSISRYAEQVHDEIQEMMCEPTSDRVLKRPDSELSTHDKIVLIESFLHAQNDVTDQRPIQMNGHNAPQNCRFVLESMTAQKVIIPLDEYRRVEGLFSDRRLDF